MKKLIAVLIIVAVVITPLIMQMNVNSALPNSEGNLISGVYLAKEPDLSLLDIDNYLVGLKNTQFNPDDKFLNKQWAIESMGLQVLWAITTGSPDITVAVLDTGIDQDHEDLAGQVIGDINFTASPTSSDKYGHGTHVAGIIAAKSNDFGVVGVAPDVKLLNVKVADDRGRCQISDLVEGIIWAVDNGANVINISIEIKESSPELEGAIQYAWERGAIIVAAAGNDSNQEPVYPAYYEDCIAVAALKADNGLAPLSNWGDWVELAAPGYKIYSTLPGNEYGMETGTSFATAQVSGVAALLFSIAVDINNDGNLNDEVLAVIKASCAEGIYSLGWGCMNVSRIAVN